MAKSRGSSAKNKRPKMRVRAANPATSPLTLWERVPPTWQHTIALAFLLLVGMGFFAQVTFGDYTLMGGDTVQWRGMAQAMFEYEEETGNRALWAPNGFSGMPGYHIHYPKEVAQIDRIPAILRGLGLWPLAHFLVLLVGVYCLVNYLVKQPLASVLAALAYGFTTYIPIILTAGHNTKFVAMAYAPWLILAFLYVLRAPPGRTWAGTLLAMLLYAAALAVNMRADHVQITYYVLIALGVVWVVYSIGSVREGDWRTMLLATGALIVGTALAALMVAQPYMAVAEYAEFTIRGGAENGLDWTYATRWSQGFGELVTLLIPRAYGGEGMTYWGGKPFTAGPHYFGPVVLLLAGLALAGIKRRVFYGIGAAVLVTVLLSLGEHLPLLKRLMFNYFPFYDAFRVPETWLGVAALFVAILAGAGLFYMSRREATTEAAERKTKAAYIGLGVIGGVLVLMLLGRGVLFPFEAPGEFEHITRLAAEQFERPVDDPQVRAAAEHYLEPIRKDRRGMFVADAWRALLFLGLAGGVIVLHRKRKIPGWVLQVGLVLLVLIDLWQVDRRYFNTDNPGLKTPSEVQRAIPEYGFDRFIQAQVEVAGGSGHFRTLPLALNPFNDGRSAYYYESVGGYHGAKLALYQDYIDELVFRQDGSLHPQGLDLTSTRFVVARQPLPGMEVAFQDSETGLFVLERPDALPRAWFVNEIEEVDTDEEAITRLQRHDLDLRQTAIMRERPEGLYARTLEGETNIQLVRHKAREIVWQVETDRPRLFVASEIYFPAGWRAQIGEAEVPIHRANHMLRAVVIPEGSHLLTMRFSPEIHRESVLITTVSTGVVYLALLMLIGLAWYRRGEGT